MRIVILALFLHLSFTGTGDAQDIPAIQPDNTDSLEWSLPPLQALIDSAMLYSPVIKSAGNEILLSKYNLTLVKRTWVEGISLQADARYGADNSYNQNNIWVPYSDRNQWRYGVGAYVRVPITEFTDRKINKQGAKIAIEQAELKKEELESSLRQLIISNYFELLSIKSTLDMYTQVMYSNNILYEQAKNDYASNKISLKDYNSVFETYLGTKNNQEMQKNTFFKAVRLMEEVIGTKIVK
ncbi:MAG: TolC family protein [Bacteroidales bacterium]|jgi:outer membrane protein TolC|nr:TolC family protein [Bacteroidales bacterium]